MTPEQSLLLEEGAKSYLDALTAVVMFQRESQSICRKILEGRLKEYSEALNVDLSAYPVVPWKTAEAQLDGTNAVLGVSQANFALRPDNYCIAFLGLFWDRTDKSPCFGATVGMWFNRNKDCEELFQAMKGLDPLPGFTLEKDKWKQIWLSITLSSTEMGVVDRKLDDLLSAWIQLCWEGLDRWTGTHRTSPPSSAGPNQS